jgi:hypothetical protein
MTQDWQDYPEYEVPDRGEWLGPVLAIIAVSIAAAFVRWVLL